MHSSSDLFILFLSSFLIGTLAAITWSNNTHSQHVLIQSEHKNLIVDLSKNTTHIVNGKVGQSAFEIEQKKIRFSASSCANKICVQQGWLSSYKPIAACIPNQVSAQLIKKNASFLDAYSF